MNVLTAFFIKAKNLETIQMPIVGELNIVI